MYGPRAPFALQTYANRLGSERSANPIAYGSVFAQSAMSRAAAATRRTTSATRALMDSCLVSRVSTVRQRCLTAAGRRDGRAGPIHDTIRAELGARQRGQRPGSFKPESGSPRLQAKQLRAVGEHSSQ